jgi:hypothetical protein
MLGIFTSIVPSVVSILVSPPPIAATAILAWIMKQLVMYIVALIANWAVQLIFWQCALPPSVLPKADEMKPFLHGPSSTLLCCHSQKPWACFYLVLPTLAAQTTSSSTGSGKHLRSIPLKILLTRFLVLLWFGILGVILGWRWIAMEKTVNAFLCYLLVKEF